MVCRAGAGTPASDGSIPLDEVWSTAAAVLENIYCELNKRLEQLQQALDTKVLGPGSPTGDVMVAYNKARVHFQHDCKKVLASFNREFAEAQTKYERAADSGRDASTAPMQRVFDRYARKVERLQHSMVDLVARGNSVLDTEQLSVSLLRYWAEHDAVMKQVCWPTRL